MRIPQSRRGFLKLGGATMLATAVIGVAGVSAPGGEHYEGLLGGEKSQVLTNKELAILLVLAERMIGPIESLPSTRMTRTAARIDRELSIVRGKLLKDVKASLLYLEYAPLLGFSGSRFTLLSEDDQDDYILALRESDKTLERNVYFGLRFLSVFFYYTDERTWNHLGYEGPFVVEKFHSAGNRIGNLEGLI